MLEQLYTICDKNKNKSIVEIFNSLFLNNENKEIEFNSSIAEEKINKCFLNGCKI